MRKWKFALAALVILFAPPFLVIGAMQPLFRLFYRLFPSASFEGYLIAVLGAHILISAALMRLLVRRRKRVERWQFVLTAIAVPLAMPFLAFWPLSLLSWSLYRLFPSTSPSLWWFFGLEVYPFLSMWLLSDMTRYVIVSLAALGLTSAALIWLAARERGQVWRRKRFYLLTVALAAVLVFPLLMRYRPAVRAMPGVELRMVEQPGLLEGAVRACQAGAEVPGCKYEPLGWADAQTLVYRKWCGGYYAEGDWRPGSPGSPMLYDLDSGESGPSLVDHALSHETCALSTCVRPALAERKPFEQGYYPGEYEEALISPDGRWVAFTARHIYGPEDLLVISRK